ncbi:50S ribosomal protein L10 [Alphaproteobacteria bacterium]|nr:50S ribosomal protein L10 [Alphaproteobacteria bacterium]
MNRIQKKQYLDTLGELSSKYSGLFVASFNKMTVKDMISFRTEIRANEGVTKISKNNIVKIFLEQSDDKKSMAENLTQQKLLIFTNNPVGTAKVCKKFEKDSKKLSAEVAFFDKTLYQKDDIAKVATLPSLDEIRGKIVGLINAPASKLVRLLLRPDQDIISILNNKKD